jgi:8-oxo-dGTP diphosphatase
MQESDQTSTGRANAAEKDAIDHLDVRVVVFSLRDERLQVLLFPSGSGERWLLPGSPAPVDQSLEETATRCLLHLTGLREVYLEQLYTYGEVDRSGPGQARLVSVVYFAIVPGKAVSSHIDKDAVQARWFPVDELPQTAWDHGEIIEYALRRLRYKLEYTALGFQLLPERFSLSQLQKTYEMILGLDLDKRNFRRRILQAGIIEETPHRLSGEGRPARLYRYRPDAVAEVKARRLFP